jgi:hypothetical protein
MFSVRESAKRAVLRLGAAVGEQLGDAGERALGVAQPGEW